MDAIDAELARAQEERKKMEEALAAGAPMAVSSVTFDTDLYGGGGSDPNRFAGYDTSIPASEDDSEAAVNPAARRLASYTGHAVAAADIPRAAEDDGLPKKSQRIIDREDDYRRRRLARIISPERHDPFAAGEATPDPSVRTYADAMRENDLQKQKEQLLRDIAQKKKEEEEKAKEKKALPEQQPVGAAIDGISRKMVMLLLLLDPRRRRPPPIGMLLMQLLGLGAGMPPLVVSGMRRRR